MSQIGSGVSHLDDDGKALALVHVERVIQSLREPVTQNLNLLRVPLLKARKENLFRIKLQYFTCEKMLIVRIHTSKNVRIQSSSVILLRI